MRLKVKRWMNIHSFCTSSKSRALYTKGRIKLDRSISCTKWKRSSIPIMGFIFWIFIYVHFVSSITSYLPEAGIRKEMVNEWRYQVTWLLSLQSIHTQWGDCMGLKLIPNSGSICQYQCQMSGDPFDLSYHARAKLR